MSKKTTKRALLTSALSLLLCFTMLLGTTYAWFTDSVTSGGNIIKAGTLDVEFKWANATENPATAAWTDASRGAIFSSDELWEPGYVSARHVSIANVGTLALQYWVRISVNGELQKNAEGHTLADAIDVYYIDSATQIANREAFNAAIAGMTPIPLSAILNNLSGSGDDAYGILYPVGTEGHDSSHTMTVALKMREEAGNEYQNMELGASFSIQLFATQWTYEKDSFDNQYDKLADIWDNYGDTSVTLTSDNLNGSLTITSETETRVSAEIPSADETSAPDDTALQYYDETGGPYNFDVEERDILLVLRVGLTDLQETSVTYDISLINITDNLILKGLNRIVTLIMAIPAGLENVSVSHSNVPMTRVNSTAAAADQSYHYDSDNGILTIWTSSFSPFSIAWTKVPTAEVKQNDAGEAKGVTIWTNDQFADQADMDEVYVFNAFNEADFTALEHFIAAFLPIVGKTDISNVNLEDFNDSSKIEAALTAMTDAGERARIRELLEERMGYLDWRADFEVTFDRDLAAGSVALGGYYESFATGFFGGAWVGFGIADYAPDNYTNPLPLRAGKTVRLLDTMYNVTHIEDMHMNYAAICMYVQQFKCGFANLGEENVGAKINVKLCLYELNEAGMETGRSVVCGEYTATLGEISDANLINIGNHN